MSNLNSLFDVVRGWPGTGTDSATITEDFRPHDSIAADNPLKEGDIVFQQSDGKVARADSEDLADAADVAGLAALIAQAQQYWLVVDGNESTNYDTLGQTGPVGANGAPAHVPWKVTCIRGTYMVETENFVGSRAYEPGAKVTVVDGQPDLIAASDAAGPGYHPYGEVREYDSTRGLLTITV